MTPHIEAKKGEIAKTVLMPGDPLRAKLIAETYLENPKLVSNIRNICAYTGTYKGKEITIMASGMGMPSMGIYSYELYKFYDVENIIRLGSCGGYTKDLDLLDLLLVDTSCTEGNFAYTFNNDKTYFINADTSLNKIITDTATKLNLNLKHGNVLCNEVFDYYISDLQKFLDRLPKDVIGVEMEAFSLFYIAKYLGKKAACILSVVDSHYYKTELSSEDREKNLTRMIKLGLESAINI